jgi:hypothetical protein
LFAEEVGALNNPLPVPAKHDSHIEHKARVELQPEFQEVDKLALDSLHKKRVDK